MKSLTIGNLILDVPFFQASLSGYSDYAMRRMARRFGCPFTLTGVMLAKSMANPRVLRKKCFQPYEDEHPVGAQIMSRTPATMAKAARDLVAVGYDVIDLNFACPAPKVLRRRRGGAMLDEPDLVLDNLKAVQDAVTCPIMMKLRMGINHKPESQAKFQQIVEQSIEAGIDALVIHGRTVNDRYRGQANWDILAEIKRTYPHATIIGSGDIFDAQESLQRMQDTGIDGIVPARGAVGNPWIFRELRALCEDKPLPAPPTLAEQKETLLLNLDWVCQDYEEKRAVGYFRKFACNYARRHPQRKKVNLAIMSAKLRKEVEAVIETWYSEEPV